MTGTKSKRQGNSASLLMLFAGLKKKSSGIPALTFCIADLELSCKAGASFVSLKLLVVHVLPV